jgi:hypothetical protein
VAVPTTIIGELGPEEANRRSGSTGLEKKLRAARMPLLYGVVGRASVVLDGEFVDRRDADGCTGVTCAHRDRVGEPSTLSRICSGTLDIGPCCASSHITAVAEAVRLASYIATSARATASAGSVD